MPHKNIQKKEERDKKIKKLLWLDMEMTGLDHEHDSVLEIAAVVTTIGLRSLDRFHSVIHHTDNRLKKMDKWCQETFENNGLISDVKRSKTTRRNTEDKLLRFLNKHFDMDVPIVIAGSSIHADRRFITKYFQKLEKRLHYRMLDVTSFSILFHSYYNKKKETKTRRKSEHRAMDDIVESISYLRFYMRFIKK